MFEPLWNRNYIDHVQITVAETVGIGRRAGYYDGAGALRDMLQNHLMQLLTLVAMEPPAALEADALRDEKVKVLRSIRPICPRDAVHAHACAPSTRPARSTASRRRLPRRNPAWPPNSVTETYVAAKFYIDNWRWRGVPFYLRTGKRLAADTSLIAIRFRHPPQQLFRETPRRTSSPTGSCCHCSRPKACTWKSTPSSRASAWTRACATQCLVPSRRERPRWMPTRRLLLDVIEGDRTLFIRFDEVEWAWRVVDPILRDWARSATTSHLSGRHLGAERSEPPVRSEDQSWRNETLKLPATSV